jgi:hypothetical protein
VVDEDLSLILYNGTNTDLNSNHIASLEDMTFDTEDKNLIKGKSYDVNYKGRFFSFFLTELPIIYLNTGDEKILDEPKIGGDLIILETGVDNFESLIGIEVRGGSSQGFPKQSFSMELWEDSAGEDSYKASLLELRSDDDWILDGLWNEPERLRDFTSHSLWLKMGRYPYEDKEPDVTLGINKKYTELFINGHYRGVYYLGEKVDRKQLELKKYDDETYQIKGELYKGYTWAPGVKFDGLEDYSNNSVTWSGYEAKYPDNIGELDWSNLHGLVDFVVNSDQTTFDASISSQVYLENMADYYIFLNMIYATDNTGKNLYTARYNQDYPYFFVPWDMDGSWGNSWTGKRTNITTGILSNGLYNKLLKNSKFKNEVKSRWNTLKLDVLSVTELQGMFSKNHNYLQSNAIYERESLDPSLPFTTYIYDDDEIDFIHGWIERRFTYLDSYFNNL